MSTITYPKIWNPGDILTAADLNAQFAAVNNITGILQSQLAVGISINAIVSAALTSAQSVSNGEVTLATLPSITTRGGKVFLIPFAMVSVQVTSGQTQVMSLRWKRAGTTIGNGQIDVSVTAATSASSTTFPLPVPPMIDSPASGSYVYTLTGVSPSIASSVFTISTNLGQIFAVEFS